MEWNNPRGRRGGRRTVVWVYHGRWRGKFHRLLRSEYAYWQGLPAMSDGCFKVAWSLHTPLLIHGRTNAEKERAFASTRSEILGSKKTYLWRRGFSLTPPLPPRSSPVSNCYMCTRFGVLSEELDLYDVLHGSLHGEEIMSPSCSLMLSV